jgi:hypothetical protein
LAVACKYPHDKLREQGPPYIFQSSRVFDQLLNPTLISDQLALAEPSFSSWRTPTLPITTQRMDSSNTMTAGMNLFQQFRLLLLVILVSYHP